MKKGTLLSDLQVPKTLEATQLYIPPKWQVSMFAHYLNKPGKSLGQEIFPTDLSVFSSDAQKTLWWVSIWKASVRKGDIFQSYELSQQRQTKSP